jgi:hypothetical protein
MRSCSIPTAHVIPFPERHFYFVLQLGDFVCQRIPQANLSGELGVLLLQGFSPS